MSQNERLTLKDKYQISLETRKLEIQLFWQRSLFFWGFISVAFIAFSSLYPDHKGFATLIAGFGLICSLVWTLANRGSKKWQEYWESKVERLEKDLNISVFTEDEELQDGKFFLYRARKYSVSKLVIALSDFVFLLWLSIILYSVLSYTKFASTEMLFPWCIIAFLIIVILYGVLIVIAARKSKKAYKTSSSPKNQVNNGKLVSDE